MTVTRTIVFGGVLTEGVAESEPMNSMGKPNGLKKWNSRCGTVVLLVEQKG